MKQVIFLTVNHHGPLPLRELHSTDETIVWRDPGGFWACLWPISDYEWTHTLRGCRWHVQTYICLWRLCDAGLFYYSVSPRTPALEGTSLHRRNNGVERPWGILSLFTTCFQLRVNSPFQRLYVIHIYVCGVFVKQVIFLTVNHRGPLPLRELHSTDETIVWRDPGGSWACLRPISDYEWIHPSRGRRWYRHIYMCVASLWSRSFFWQWITVDPSPWGNFTPPTKQ